MTKFKFCAIVHTQSRKNNKFNNRQYTRGENMQKINGLIYLNEDEWENEKLREEYPDAMLSKWHRKQRRQGREQQEEVFYCSGANRRQRRHGI